ncbi:MAG: DNA mismatch repair protein MutS [Dehalococcoidia bacterium]|nr:DNA mismatch repair protein MutS [Dehalococcoidia bacterium]
MRSSPARAQYLALKRQHADAILLFRMGDFYETFDDDARLVAGLLGVALTSRPMGGDEGRVPLAGVPHHVLERHLDRLVAAGHRVAIVEQIGVEQTSAPGRGLIERRVVRVVTPGTVDAGSLLAADAHNWLVALAPDGSAGGAGAGGAGAAGARWGLAACDVTTGELECTLVAEAELAGAWARLGAHEAIVPEGVPQGLPEASALEAPPGVRLTARPTAEFAPQRGAERLAARFGVASLAGYGLEGLDAAVGAAGALLAYLEESWPVALAHLRPPRAVRAAEHMYIDPQTRRTLELFGGGRAGEASLVDTIDRTLTPLGARLLRARLARPLRRAAAAAQRLDEVEAFVRAPLARAALRRELRGVPDLERLLGRVRAGSASARQLVQLRHGLERLPAVAAQAAAAGAPAASAARGLGGVATAAALVAAAIADEPPAEPSDGGTIRTGWDARIDELRALATDARGALAAFEAEERGRTGLASLRAGYHRVFGYYWELPASQAAHAPAEYEPRQTLAGTRRFRSPALAALETRILAAREELEQAERAAFERVRAELAAHGAAIAHAAEAVARLDVAAALAEVAAEHGYVRPELAESGPLVIIGGRHPVVERRLAAGVFVPNDCTLGGSAGDGEAGGADIVLLTGPNMGGKSTYLRQVALVVLLAQCGSYVPAERARVPMVDRIFSRVGAQDDIASGQSTFMVEMVETAAILHNATERSLVLLDEVGRGTATADGLAIARAVVEHLHHRPGGTPRTLFATHFQELVGLAALLPRVENRSVAVIEERGEVVFLHRIAAGGADRAYGVHVAALAGLPAAVVARARELLLEAERTAISRRLPPAAGTGARLGGGREATLPPAVQPPLAVPGDAVVAELAGLDPDALTPLSALQRLYELRQAARRALGGEA